MFSENITLALLHSITFIIEILKYSYFRHAPAEVDEIAKRDLTALSTFLADKPYFFGSHPSTVSTTNNQ